MSDAELSAAKAIRDEIQRLQAAWKDDTDGRYFDGMGYFQDVERLLSLWMDNLPNHRPPTTDLNHCVTRVEARQRAAMILSELNRISPTPNTATTGTNRDPGGTERGEGGEANPVTATDSEVNSLETLSPCRKKAYQQYLNALTRNLELKEGTDQQVYGFVEDHLEQGETLPTFATWVKYVREGRKATHTQKNSPRAGRETGRSIVRPEET